MNEIRSRVRALIFGITGIIVAFLIFRIGLDLVGADSENGFFKFIFDISDFFIASFKGLIEIGGVASTLNFDAMLALGVYIIGAVIFAEIITAFLYDNLQDIVQNIVDGLFKFLEFILFLRIVFELFALSSRAVLPEFVNTVFGLTNWTQGILFDIKIESMSIDLGAILILILVIVLDVVSERFIRRIFEYKRKRSSLSAGVSARASEKITVGKKDGKGENEPEQVKEKKKAEEKKDPVLNTGSNVEKYVPRTDLPEYKEYSDKTEAPEIKISKPDAEDPDPETADKKA